MQQRKALKILDGLNSRHVHDDTLRVLNLGSTNVRMISESDKGKELLRLPHVVLEHHGLCRVQAQEQLVEGRLIFGAMLNSARDASTGRLGVRVLEWLLALDHHPLLVEARHGVGRGRASLDA